MYRPAPPVQRFTILPTLRALPATLLVLTALGLGFMACSSHDDQRCIELALLALLFPFMLARIGWAGQLVCSGWLVRACLGGFFALGAISVLNALSLRHAIYEWSSLLLLLLAAALLAAELAREGGAGLQIVLRGMLVVALLYSMRVVLWYGAALANGIQIPAYELTIGFGNVRFFNHVQTVLLPLALILSLQAPKGSAWRRAAVMLAAWWWALLFVSQARASILGLLAGCGFAFLLRGARARGFLRAMLASALAGLAVYALAFILLPLLAGLPPFDTAGDVLQRTAADPTSRRNLLWALALKLIAAHPWLGVGPHHFAHEGARLYWGAHPHNFILQFGAEWGLPALACVLVLVALGMRALVRGGARIAPADLPNQQVLAALLATGAAILVDGLFSGVLVMPQSQLAIVLYLGCAAGWLRSLEGKAAPRTGADEGADEGAKEGADVGAVGALRWLLPALAAAAFCGLAWAVAPSLAAHATQAELTPAEKRANPGLHWPRLWEAGYF